MLEPCRPQARNNADGNTTKDSRQKWDSRLDYNLLQRAALAETSPAREKMTTGIDKGRTTNDGHTADELVKRGRKRDPL